MNELTKLLEKNHIHNTKKDIKETNKKDIKETDEKDIKETDEKDINETDEKDIKETDEKDIKETDEKIKNKGNKAGGANTNKNGLPYEKLTDLDDHHTIINITKNCKTITFINYDKQFLYTKQSKFFKCMVEHMVKNILHAHGCKNPDECYINISEKKIFIIEKKFQQVAGSICEKIQTPDFKLWQYNRLFPTFEIIYIYCLSDWFKLNCKAELEYLTYKKIKVFFGNDDNYKSKIVKYINKY
jgi:hypothetical protein